MGTTIKSEAIFKEDVIILSPMIVSEDIQAHENEEEMKVDHVASGADLSGEEQKSKIEVSGNDNFKIETSPTPNETNEDKVINIQQEVGGVEYKWKVVMDDNEMEITPLFTTEDIRAQLGCSVYSHEDACAKAVDAKSGATCQWRTDTTTGVEACLTEKVEFINTVEIGGVEFKFKVTIEGNELLLDMIAPQEELFSKISDEHGIADIAGVKEIPKLSHGLRGAMG